MKNRNMEVWAYSNASSLSTRLNLISSRDEIMRSMGGLPWAWFRIEEPRTLALGNDTGLIAYRAKAKREGGEVYSALISSVYVRRGSEWKMVFHQQTLE